jgi:chromosome segregation ATPase
LDEVVVNKVSLPDTQARGLFGMTFIDRDQLRGIDRTTQGQHFSLAALEHVRLELEQCRRDLATRTGERNGARQRIAILEDEIDEREMKVVQLREELRLEREEDPLADKLFIELVRLRNQFEEVEDQKAKAQGNIEWLEKKVCDNEAKRIEEFEKLRVLEEGAESGNTIVAECERRIQAGNDQLGSLTSALYAREAEIEGLNTQFATLLAEIEQLNSKLAATKEKLWQANSAELNTDEISNFHPHLNAEIQRLTSRLATGKQDLESTGYQTGGCQSLLQRAFITLTAVENKVEKLSAELKQVKEERDRAQNEARKASEVGGLAPDEKAERRHELGAANDMGHRLPLISSENIPELIHLREGRDSAVHDVSRLTRDLSFSRDEVTALKSSVVEFKKEIEVLIGRCVEAERRAGEYERQAIEREDNLEELRKLVQHLAREGVDKSDGDDTTMEGVLDGILGDDAKQETLVASAASLKSPMAVMLGEEPGFPARPAPRGPKSKPRRPEKPTRLRGSRIQPPRATKNSSPSYLGQSYPATLRRPKRLPPRGGRAEEDHNYEAVSASKK